MKIDINDAFALIGSVMLTGGITPKYGWETALITLGGIILFLGVWRAR